MENKRVAIVILNWNGAEMLRRFLPSVIESAGDIARVIVADNASTDESFSLVESEFSSVEIIKLDKNYGFADGYNKALAQVEAEYYVLLNSDVEVKTGWLEPLVSIMDEHQDVAACQPKILSFKNRSLFEYAGASGGWIDYLGYPFCRGRIFDAVEKDEGQYDTVQDIFWATGAALMIRSADYRKVGGLDGRFFAHMEEIDLCWRLRSRGRRILCIPESTVFHVGGATLKKENPRKTYLNFRNNLLMLYKNLPDDEVGKIIFLRMILDGVAALQFLFKFQFGNLKAVYKAHCDFRKMRPDFKTDRQENMSKTKLRSIPERINRSILIEYYLKKHRKFSDIIS
ncbi:MAG: glycosyltransferase family 2 protein [Bacteroidaceae bacterium]|nr:glycosyltransferase family 2 protein [Bacteroidaceae bacterium]